MVLSELIQKYTHEYRYIYDSSGIYQFHVQS